MRAHPLLPAVALATALSVIPVVFPLRAELPAPSSPPAAGARDWNPRQTPVVEVVRRVKDAVVNIHSERTARAPDADVLFNLTPSQNRVNGMGTGIVIDPRGYIITNQHVVDDVSSLRVRLADGTTLNARVLARDTENDLALLKIAAPRSLPVMPVGTARDLQVGETVVAIGNAYGYDHTVTVGVVSAIGRDVTLNREVRYRALIQTDASINPGNSGGPLINLHGELVGVNVAIRAGAQGIGFAIPVDTMISVGCRLMEQVLVQQALAPVGVVARDDLVTTSASSRRVVIDRVDPGTAARAGLRAGDVLVQVGGVPVRCSLDLPRGLLERSGGDRVPVVVRREGAERKLELTLQARPQVAPVERLSGGSPSHSATQPANQPAGKVWRGLGVRLSSPANLAEIKRKHPQLHGGLIIGEVRPDSPAARAGLRVGDVLIGLHEWEMLNLDNVLYVLEHPDRAGFLPLRFYILRGGEVHRGWLNPAE